MSHLFYRDVRSEGARAGAHDLLHPRVAPVSELVGAKQAEDNTFLVDHDARVPPGFGYTLADIADAFLELASRHVATGDVAGSRTTRVRTFGGKTCRQPVELAVRVVIDLRETNTLEPPRGSRA